MRVASTVAWLSTLALGLACGSSDGPAPFDAGSVGDAGTTQDASLTDAGSPLDSGQGLDAGVEPTDECNPVTQSGCSPPDTKCVVEGSVGTECVEPNAADAPFGGDCTGRDCVAGLVCAAVGTSTASGECIQVCDPASGSGCESLGPDYDCTTLLTGTNWGACRELSAICDPYDQTPCGPTQGCQPFRRRSGAWEFRCRNAGSAADGSACGPGSNMTCQRGSACVADPSGNSVCRRICQTTVDCDNSEQCAGSVSNPPFMYCAP